MSKQTSTYEALGKAAQAENPTLIEKIAHWIRDFLENAE